jgi:hypothetical protein
MLTLYSRTHWLRSTTSLPPPHESRESALLLLLPVSSSSTIGNDGPQSLWLQQRGIYRILLWLANDRASWQLEFARFSQGTVCCCP